MHKFTTGMAATAAVLAMLAGGCAGDKGSKSGEHADKHTQAHTDTTKHTDAAPAGMKACVMQLDGHDALRMMVPADGEVSEDDGAVRVRSRSGFVNIWAVRGASTIEDGIHRIPETISPEFKGFKSTSTADLTVAGSPAKRLMGTGVEADDDDPGTADVVVFTVNNQVFVACVHGESLQPTAQHTMMAIVQSAHP